MTVSTMKDVEARFNFLCTFLTEIKRAYRCQVELFKLTIDFLEKILNDFDELGESDTNLVANLINSCDSNIEKLSDLFGENYRDFTEQISALKSQNLKNLVFTSEIKLFEEKLDFLQSDLRDWGENLLFTSSNLFQEIIEAVPFSDFLLAKYWSQHCVQIEEELLKILYRLGAFLDEDDSNTFKSSMIEKKWLVDNDEKNQTQQVKPFLSKLFVSSEINKKEEKPMINTLKKPKKPSVLTNKNNDDRNINDNQISESIEITVDNFTDEDTIDHINQEFNEQTDAIKRIFNFFEEYLKKLSTITAEETGEVITLPSEQENEIIENKLAGSQIDNIQKNWNMLVNEISSIKKMNGDLFNEFNRVLEDKDNEISLLNNKINSLDQKNSVLQKALIENRRTVSDHAYELLCGFKSLSDCVKKVVSLNTGTVLNDKLFTKEFITYCFRVTSMVRDSIWLLKKMYLSNAESISQLSDGSIGK